jgi:hypothetical protein
LTIVNSSSWHTSSGTTTAGDYTDDWMQTTATTTGTGSNGYPLQTNYYTYQEIPTPPSDPEAIRRHELRVQRREPLERWREAALTKLRERQKKEEVDASECARRLLFEYLDEKNRKNFTEEKTLEVESGIRLGVKYQIPYYDGRIKAWRGDKVVSELCLQVRAPEWIPHEDKILAKLLYLQGDEAHALRTANHSNIKENLLEGLN